MSDVAYLKKLPFESALPMALAHLDRVQSARDKHWNRYFIGLALRASDDVLADVAAGMSKADAFAEGFTPSREMHRVAKWLDLPLRVDRGQWVQATAP